MDGDIFYVDDTPMVIEGLDAAIEKPKTLVLTQPSDDTVICIMWEDGTYCITPDLTAEEYKLGLEMVIEYFTKGAK